MSLKNKFARILYGCSALLVIAFMVTGFFSGTEGITAEAGHLIPKEAFSYNNHYYMVYNDLGSLDTSSWMAAQKLCNGRGGHLAILDTPEEDEFVFSKLRELGYESAFFGLYLKEGVWTWVNSQPAEYTHWGDGEPNGGEGEPYAMYYYKYPDGSWNDGRFNVDSSVYICEWDSGNPYTESVEYDRDSTPLIPEDAVTLNGKYYKVYNDGLNVGDAADFCSLMGGHLVTINSQEEQDFVMQELERTGTKNMYWIGARQDENYNWYWTDGSYSDYINWSEYEPRNSDGNSIYCVINFKSENYDKGGWVAQSYVGAEYRETEYYPNYGFICEWEFRCQSENGNFMYHDYNERWETVKEPDCVGEGKRVRRCRRCNSTIEDSIEPLGHDYVIERLVEDFEFNPLPGMKKFVCNRCNGVKTEYNFWIIGVDAFAVMVVMIFFAARSSAKKEWKKRHQPAPKDAKNTANPTDTTDKTKATAQNKNSGKN